MVKILPYNPKVEIIWSTPKPAEVVGMACSTTQKGIFAENNTVSSALIQFLHSAKHGNPLEHAVICLDIAQISRACADQLRTHRTCSPTMSSTHYQDHSDYPHRISIEMLNKYQACHPAIGFKINEMMDAYKYLVKEGVPKEDARQLLPLSTEVRYMLTINARSLAHFIQLRSCYRNTIETILCANHVWQVAQQWFPELFDHVGKPCDFEGCHEGKMRCDKQAVKERLDQYDSVI